MTPNHELKYCGNHSPGTPAVRSSRLTESGEIEYETQAEADEGQRRWLSNMTIGKAQGTDVYTADELTAMGMVGIYRWVPTEEKQEAV